MLAEWLDLRSILLPTLSGINIGNRGFLISRATTAKVTMVKIANNVTYDHLSPLTLSILRGSRYDSAVATHKE